MGTRLNAIRQACSLQPEERTEENVTDILDFVRDVKFFSKLTTLQQRTLCRTMTIEKFGPREAIFEVGDKGDKYYIILSGGVSVQVPSPNAPCPNKIHEERCDCTNRPLETAVFLAKGMGFGELALQSSQPRSATILTGEPTETLVTTRADYEKYAGELHKLFIEQRVKFLRQCPLIEQSLQEGMVSTQDIAAMANCLNERSLHGNEMVVRQGEAVEVMIFVRSGSLAMLKLVDNDCREPLLRGIPRRPAMGTGKGGGRGDARGSGRGGRGRGAGRGSAKAKEDISEGEDSEEEFQSPRRGTFSLAKAMIQLKQVERDDKLGKLYMNTRSKGKEEAQEFTETVFGRRNSFRLEGADAAALVAGGPIKKTTSSKSRDGSKQSVRSEMSAFSTLSSESPSPRRTGKELWAKVRKATRRAYVVKLSATMLLESLLRARTKSKSRHNAPEVAKPQTAPGGRRPAQARTPRKPGSAHHQHMATKKLLRIGSVGAFQFCGDKEVCNNEVFPCSLVSDPIAEIYTMSKHDILRRLPKNLFSAMFNQENQHDPSDSQLLDMLRQNERWSTFRRSMHGEALVQRDQERALRGRLSTTGGRVDAVANLEFLGVNPHGAFALRTLPPPRKILGAALTPKDEELFSQTSARFLRRFDIMKRDPGLQTALAKAGVPRRLRAGNEGEDSSDPMAIRFEQHWSKLRQDPVSLDLGDDLDDLTRSPLLSKNAGPAAGGTASGEGSAGNNQLDRTLLPGQTLEGSSDQPPSNGSAGPGWTASITAELPPIVTDSAGSGRASTAEAADAIRAVGSGRLTRVNFA
eukprot:gb/GFBE01069798.1/.p1 GENE.gb/GFBE01069798.1/~~gb/GFBE01069798.1/.p1  ORF type:complete len:806 (+),score=176.60 gb/GFBE01069798.1/:1-2418(+)